MSCRERVPVKNTRWPAALVNQPCHLPLRCGLRRTPDMRRPPFCARGLAWVLELAGPCPVRPRLPHGLLQARRPKVEQHPDRPVAFAKELDGWRNSPPSMARQTTSAFCGSSALLILLANCPDLPERADLSGLPLTEECSFDEIATVSKVRKSQDVLAEFEGLRPLRQSGIN